jgi:hypothetical protein
VREYLWFAATLLAVLLASSARIAMRDFAASETPAAGLQGLQPAAPK